MSEDTIGAPNVGRYPPVKVWVKTARPVSLTASITPLLVGAAVAFYAGTFHPLPFFEALLAGAFLQIGANYFNEYFDYRYGLDSHESLGASTVIFRNEMTAKQVLGGGIAVFSAAAVLGILLIIQVGYAILLFGVAAMAIAYFYSAKPFKLAARGFGDIFVMVAMGFLVTWGSYYVQIPHWSWQVFAASIPVSFLVDAILNMNNLRDYDDDKKVHKMTIPVRFGRDSGKAFHMFLVFGSFAAVTLFVIFRVLPYPALIIWFALPLAISHIQTILPETDRRKLARGMPQISRLHLDFGVLLAVGVVFAALLRIH